MVKVALNRAMHDPRNGLTDYSAWRLVKPFANAGKPRETRYTDAEARRLVTAAPDRAIGSLIAGAFLTGARFGELASAHVSAFDLQAMTLRVTGKTGARTIILQKAAAEFLSGLAAGRQPADFLFVREDGARWKRSEQTRPFKTALKAAGLPADSSIYALRHTYISRAIEDAVPLNVIAENCGTSVRMIEKTYAKILAEKRFHFCSEENVMESIGYPELEEHREKRAQGVDALSNLILSATLDSRTPEEVEGILREWFFDHTGTDDRKIGEFVKQRA